MAMKSPRMDGRELDYIFDLLEATTGPLGQRGRELIRVCLETPTIETWDDVHALVLRRRPFLNYMAAVRTIDPDYYIPERSEQCDGAWLRNWDYAPRRDVLVDALRLAAYGPQ